MSEQLTSQEKLDLLYHLKLMEFTGQVAINPGLTEDPNVFQIGRDNEQAV